MKARELRLGNLIEFDNRIQPKKVVEVNVRFFCSIAGGRPENEMKPDEEISNYYSPIPLTEEWLENKGYVGKIIEQSGFVKKHIHFEIGGRISIDIYGDNNEIWIFWKGQLIRDYKKYSVHQLQNLYYALTGEEL